ncbi:GH36 C-terminal domain-containing protein [Paenibacillus sp. HWE-109]|uniref:GH36 C-terminal domain-containing protein n=1 Tax=Paenibacillus sp. HWE-109 TaxID=1306526 RepID=UPI001EDF67AC|nr:GH36 C-terminal domain-containing protein [Paenibacillus sp. HWE-109]UKS26805.1 GH36 C-terminal domain-containing protein [Paenibacillus sp. HWE-109]
MHGKTMRIVMSLLLMITIGFTGIPFASQGSIPTAQAANALVTRSGNVWTLENDVMKSVVSFASGSIQMTSFYNKEASKEYLTGTGSQYLFYYNYGGSDLYANDGGWTLGTATVTDITKFGTNWGKLLTIPVTRSTPQNVTINLKFEIYNGNSGIKYSNSIKNNAASDKTITNSDILALNLPNDPHTLHYVPNMAWFSTTGALAPNTGRNAITVYDTGDGWGLQPEMNWKTEGAPNRLPFASINAWSGITNVKLSTNTEALQLVLFPNEEFEYISVNMTVFKGDIVDGKMAVEEHFRKRFKYHDVTSLFTTNDWDYIASRSDAFFRNTVIPKAAQAGLDMVMVDDLWNTTRDTTTAKTSFTTNLASLTDYIVSQGLRFGLWFSMTGDNHDLGRDLADPANIEFKRSQVEDTLIPQYHLSHQMIDLTEFWPNTAATTTSHPSDSVYRKNVLVRNYMNDLVSRHPDFIGKLTSEVDIYPTQGDRNNGLLHISDNGFLSANGGVGTSMKIGMDSFGYLPMNSVYYGGNPSGKVEDYYSYMMARVIKFNTDPTSWTTAGISSLRKFNDWRKSPRIKALTDQTTRPLYAGPDFDTSGSYAWMYTTEDKAQALVIATAANTGGATDVTLNLRWLDSNKTYLVEDITMDDSGNSSYMYKGKFTGAQLKSTGLSINLAENTSKGKAFWLQEDNASSGMQVLYADEKVSSFTQVEGASSLMVNVTGTANSTGKVIVFDRTANKAITSDVAIGAGGTGSVTINSGTKFEAESLTTLVSTGDTSANGADAAASNGSLSYGNFNAAGDWIQYTVNVPSPGTYRLKTQVKKHPSRGTAQLYIDGTAQGSPIDEYQSAQAYVEVDLGNVTFNTAGNKLFKFQVTGKNASSSGYGLATDYIRLTYQSPDILLPPAVPEAVKYENESLTTTVSSGMTSAIAADTAASNGSLSYGNATAVGNWVQYTVNVPSTGTYRVRVQVKKHPSRGIAQLYIDGAAQGAPIDEYQSAQAYVVVDLGDVTFAAPGNKQFKFQVTGKNASSASYGLATDYISLTKQPLILENESLTTSVSSGDSFANTVDTAASGGSVSYGNFNAVGDWIQYTVNVPTAGTYAISARVKKHPDRGTEQLLIDGVAQGSPIDQHDSPQGYAIVGLGEKIFPTAGNKLFKFQITGKDPGSASLTLAHDSIILTRIN